MRNQAEWQAVLERVAQVLLRPERPMRTSRQVQISGLAARRT